MKCRNYDRCKNQGKEYPSEYNTVDKPDTVIMCESCYIKYCNYFHEMRSVCSGKDFPGWHDRTIRE